MNMILFKRMLPMLGNRDLSVSWSCQHLVIESIIWYNIMCIFGAIWSHGWWISGIWNGKFARFRCPKSHWQLTWVDLLLCFRIWKAWRNLGGLGSSFWSSIARPFVSMCWTIPAHVVNQRIHLHHPPHGDFYWSSIWCDIVGNVIIRSTALLR